MPRPRKPPRLERQPASDPTAPWYILWHDGERDRRRSTNTRDPGEAQGQFKNFLEELGKPAPSSAGPRSLESFAIADAIGIYCDEHIAGKPSAVQTVTWVNRLLEFWGEQPISAITKETTKAYIEHRRAKRGFKGRKHVSDGTIERELTVLRAAVNHCWKGGKLSSRPLPIMSLDDAPDRDLWLEPEDVGLLIDNAQPHVVLWCYIAISSGSRKTAILEMKWRGQIDFVARTIDLKPPGAKQTSKIKSKVPMTSVVYDALLAAHKVAKTPYVIEFPFPKKGADGKVERDADGQAIYENRPIANIRTGFRRAARRAAWAAIARARAATEAGDIPMRHRMIKTAWRVRKATPHTIRHTAATWMAQAGDSLAKIGGFIGHTDPRTTAKYAHHHPDYLRDLASSLDERFQRGIKPKSGEG